MAGCSSIPACWLCAILPTRRGSTTSPRPWWWSGAPRPAGGHAAPPPRYGQNLAAARQNPRRRHLVGRTQHRPQKARRWRAAAQGRQRRHRVLSNLPGGIMEGVTIVKHPLVQHKLTLIRAKNISTKSFRELLKEIGMLLCYEVTRDLPLTDVEIETPMARMMSPRLAGKKLVFAPILRAGVTFAEGMLDLVPAARVAHIGLYREPESFVAVEYFFKAPSDLDERLVIVVAPVIATANTAAAAVVRLKE